MFPVPSCFNFKIDARCSQILTYCCLFLTVFGPKFLVSGCCSIIPDLFWSILPVFGCFWAFAPCFDFFWAVVPCFGPIFLVLASFGLGFGPRIKILCYIHILNNSSGNWVSNTLSIFYNTVWWIPCFHYFQSPPPASRITITRSTKEISKNNHASITRFTKEISKNNHTTSRLNEEEQHIERHQRRRTQTQIEERRGRTKDREIWFVCVCVWVSVSVTVCVINNELTTGQRY